MSAGGKVERSERAFDRMEGMPPTLRECVHEFGFATVNACLCAGVRDAGRIRMLIHEIWAGARQPSQRMEGIENNSAIGKLDWMLLQSGSQVSAKALLRSLAQSNHVLVPRDPTRVMVAASMDATNHFGVVSKFTKHQNRLRAAVLAQAKTVWPDFYS